MPVAKEIRLIGRGGKFDFAVPLGMGIATPSGGGAVYEETERPQDTAITTFTGNALIRLDVPVLFDSFRGGKADQMPRIMQILNLARGERDAPPPNFIAKGPIPYSGRRWQMEAPEWSNDPSPIRDADGRVLRQGLILKLVEYQDPDQLRFVRQRFKRGTALVAPGHTELTRPESLVEVAARIYDDPSEAKRLGKLNKIHDVRKKLPAGTSLRLRDFSKSEDD